MYLYFLGLSLRSTSKAIEPFEARSYYVAVWYWIQEFNPKNIFPNKNKNSRIITAFIIIDETAVQIGETDAWLWVAT
ncbi:MAG: hypothetical protein JO327_01435, partial [Nitrososphaeraceae archaeon]|nr:hypothetical protein [Nitrososphaeraceae archaeon]